MENRGTTRRSGQTMAEYVIVLVAFIGVFFAVHALVGAIRSNGDRSLDLVASEYP